MTAHLLPETKGMSMDMTDERINLSHEGTVGIGFDDRGKGENINADEFVDIRNPVAKDIELSLGER